MNTKNFPPDCVFIIPTLSNEEGLYQTLYLISQFYPETQVVVINNNPGRQIKPRKLQVVIQNQKNEGFAKACNQGAIKAQKLFNPRYLVFLNDDVSWDADWLRPSVEKIESEGWIAASPVLKKNDGTIENCGYRVLPYGKISLIQDLNNKESIDGISAAALIIDSRVFSKIGGFDERFFAYLEDVDLFLRLKKMDYAFGIAKNVSVIHEGQQTSSKFKTKKSFYDFRNWMLLLQKNWTLNKFVKNFPAIIIERLRNFWGIIKTIT